MSTSASSNPTSLPHYPALDGLRGIAVLAVVAVHTLVLQNTTGIVKVMTDVASMGWLGVDLFFVLSGFLITSILLRVPATWRGARNFIIRRALRTWPLYYATFILAIYVLSVTSIYASTGLTDARNSQIWFYLHASNLLFAFRKAWTAICISHYWSLAVEEQFYLVWPTVVLCLRGRLVPWACGILMVVGPVTRIVLYKMDAGFLPLRVFTLCNVDSLAMGSLVGFLVYRYGAGYRRVAWALLGVGLGYLGVFHVVMGGYGFHAYGLSAVLMVFAAGIYLCLSPGRVTGALLGRGVLPWFGKYSYGLYVLHHFLRPVYEHYFSPQYLALRFDSKSLASVVFAALVLGCSTLAAVVSYHFFEAPFLTLKDRFR